MSFDPHKLYTHPQKKSHQGQIIQKRPVDAHYAASHEDLKRAFIVAKTYGYTMSKGISFTEFAVCGGQVSFNTDIRSVSFSDIVNQDTGDLLRLFNQNIFNHIPNHIQIIVNVSQIAIESTAGFTNCHLVDGTNFTISSYGYRLVPLDSSHIRLIRLGDYSITDINRGTPQNYNTGIIYDISNNMTAYNALKSGTPIVGSDPKYINCAGTGNLTGSVFFTLVLITSSN